MWFAQILFLIFNLKVIFLLNVKVWNIEPFIRANINFYVKILLKSGLGLVRLVTRLA